ncbi:MAG: YbjN domain-containing protein [Cyanobacteria bacterium J06639_16]
MMLSSVDPPLELTTDNCYTLPLDRPITLYTPPDAEANVEGMVPFTGTAVQLTVIKEPSTMALEGRSLTIATASEDPIPKDCHLILSVSLAQYQQILDQSLFHLKPEVRGPLQQADFLPDLPILLELGLQPHLFIPGEDAHAIEDDLPPLASSLENPAENRKYTTSLVTELLTVLEQSPSEQSSSEQSPSEQSPSEQSPPVNTAPDYSASDFLKTLLDDLSDDLAPDTIVPWRKTDGWLCRSVQQRQADQTVGYATLWAYTNPEQADPVMASGSATLEAIASLLQKTTDAVKTEVEQELPQLQQNLSQFSDQLMTALEHVDWETVMQSFETAAEDAEPPPPISEIVKQFFDEDDWAYVQLSDPSILQLAFQGSAGRWTCLAQCNNDAAQVVFYSLCPITVPEANYGAIAELLMRANDGLIIGNFELDFAQGEIRYKTSLDVEGDRLTPALMRCLVYANVQTLDTYLPSIMAVLEGQCSPTEAIARVEQSDEGMT